MKFRLFIPIAILLLISCNTPPNSSSEKLSHSDPFKQYLKENFNYEIPTDSSVFVLVCTNGCSGCLEEIFDATNNNKMNKGVNVIISKDAITRYSLETEKANYWIDTNNNIDKLHYHQGNVAIIRCYKKNISSVQQLEPADVVSAIKTISK